MKKSEKLTTQEMLKRPPFPLPLFPKDTKVKVFMGAGWSIGYVEDSRQDQCSVRLVVGNRLITVKDSRSIMRAA